jgi:hypothetical protein
MTHENPEIMNGANTRNIVAATSHSVLPKTTKDQTGEEVLDYRALYSMEMTPVVVASYLEYLHTELSSDPDDTNQLEQADRLLRGIPQIVGFFDQGHIQKTQDLIEACDLFTEFNPQKKSVQELLNRGMDLETINYVYARKDYLGISIEQTIALFSVSGLDIKDSDDEETMYEAIEHISEKRRFSKSSAANVIIERLASGEMLMDILDY